MSTLLTLASHHALGFVLAAAVICAVAAGLLTALIAHAESRRGRARGPWLAGIAVVAGIGVWTTHFMAMLGYRPDLALGYDGLLTAGSCLVALVAVGLPLAASAAAQRRVWRVGFGAAAGLGVGVMHAMGMAAIEGCLRTQAPLPSLVAAGLGTVFMAASRALPSAFRFRFASALLITAAVCGTHFVAVSGTRLEAVADGLATGDNLVLSIFTAAGAVVLFVGVFLTILAVRRFDAQERSHSTILTTALQNMSNGLLFLDENQRLRLFNGRFVEMCRLAPGNLKAGMTLPEFFDVVGASANWDAAQRAKLEALFRTRFICDQEQRIDYAAADGRAFEIESRPLPDGGVVLTFDDVTSSRRAQDQIERLAFHDPLTGLANRHALQRRMAEGFQPKLRFKLLLIDLDRFKFVNDTFGHGVGDKLLVEVARRIQAIAGGEHFVARLGGDEMALLVFGDLDRATAVARSVIEAIGMPFQIEAATLSIGCSIGMCCTDDAENAEELLRRADLALYQSKRHGRGRVSCYQQGMVEAAADRHHLEQDLRVALGKGEFHLVYQPVVAVADGRLVGYEALIRWEHPTRGSVPPALFIPLAEEIDQIGEIGRWVLEEACREAATWDGGLHVAVNVSAVQFRSPLLFAHVTGALARSGLAPNRLEIELTETALVEDGRAICRVLEDLRRLGVKVAMDDFGTGYSSLAHLCDFPLDRIKIDRSFVARAETDRGALAVLRAVVQMGRDMDVATLAEGVETENQMLMLRRLGCGAVQGYLTGRPQRLRDAAAPTPLARAG